MREVLTRYPQHALIGALCAGLASGLAVRPPGTATAALAGLVACAAVAVAPYHRLLLLAAGLLLAGSWLGGARADAFDASVLAADEGRAGITVAIVTGPARGGTFTIRVPARVERFREVGVRERVLLRLPAGRAPPQGARLRFVATVTPPRRADEAGGFDERRWLARQGVHVVLKVGEWEQVGRRGGLGGVADRLRGHLVRTISPGVGGERQAVIAGVVLGEDEGLSQELQDAFRASGLYHLLAVSGQNVAFIAGGVLLLAWLLGVPRLVAEVAVLVAIVGYVLAVGWQPSVVRAGIAGGLASLAWLAARERDRWYFLLVGAAVLLAWNPYSLLEPGFQLSFAAVAGIFLGVPRLDRVLEGYPLPRPLRLIVAVSTVCGAATAPIVWLHFHAVPLYTVPANALAAPVVAPLLGLGLLAAGLEPVLPGAAAAVAWLNGWCAAYLAACARLVAALPGAQATSWRGVGLAAGVLVLAVALVRARDRVRRRILVLAVCVLALGGGWWLLPREAPPPAGLRIAFLDVGQGDAVLLQTREHAVLVDQGPPEARVWEQLRALRVRRLTLLVPTHDDRDHAGGAADVLSRVGVGTLVDFGGEERRPDGEAALAEARRRAVPVVVARAGRTYRLGRLHLRVLSPRRAARAGEEPNDFSIVLLASYGELDVLLTGDAEGHVTVPLRPPRVEVLKVAHHGSADPALPALLERVRPRVAVISAGPANPYGHPARSTLAALAAVSGLRVYRTDRDGRVTIETDGDRFVVRRER